MNWPKAHAKFDRLFGALPKAPAVYTAGAFGVFIPPATPVLSAK